MGRTRARILADRGLIFDNPELWAYNEYHRSTDCKEMKTMITTTLQRIQDHSPYSNGWRKLLKGLGKTKPDDEILSFAKIVEINGLVDALYYCRVEPQYAKEWRLFAIWCARQVQHLMNDQRSVSALNVAEAFANGLATADELQAAHEIAWDAPYNVAWTATHPNVFTAMRETAREAKWIAASQTMGETQTQEFLRIVS